MKALVKSRAERGLWLETLRSLSWVLMMCLSVFAIPAPVVQALIFTNGTIEHRRRFQYRWLLA